MGREVGIEQQELEFTLYIPHNGYSEYNELTNASQVQQGPLNSDIEATRLLYKDEESGLILVWLKDSAIGAVTQVR